MYINIEMNISELVLYTVGAVILGVTFFDMVADGIRNRAQRRKK